jgi:CheY-like chemotaxis protein
VRRAEASIAYAETLARLSCTPPARLSCPTPCRWPVEVVPVAAASRRRQLEAARDAALEEADAARPTLLLADDEPALLVAMAELLADAGYAVSRVDSGHGAIQLLEHEDFDAIVTDWNLDDGNGADIYRWIAQVKPWLAERVVFLADEEGEHTSQGSRLAGAHHRAARDRAPGARRAHAVLASNHPG